MPQKQEEKNENSHPQREISPRAYTPTQENSSKPGSISSDNRNDFLKGFLEFFNSFLNDNLILQSASMAEVKAALDHAIASITDLQGTKNAYKEGKDSAKKDGLDWQIEEYQQVLAELQSVLDAIEKTEKKQKFLSFIACLFPVFNLTVLSGISSNLKMLGETKEQISARKAEASQWLSEGRSGLFGEEILIKKSIYQEPFFSFTLFTKKAEVKKPGETSSEEKSHSDFFSRLDRLLQTQPKVLTLKR